MEFCNFFFFFLGKLDSTFIAFNSNDEAWDSVTWHDRKNERINPQNKQTNRGESQNSSVEYTLITLL